MFLFRVKRRGFLKTVVLLACVVIIIVILRLNIEERKIIINEYGKHDKREGFISIFKKWKSVSDPDTFFSDPEVVANQIKIKWNDRVPYRLQMRQKGLGEGGKQAALSHPDPRRKKEAFDLFGFDGYLSESIALNRSLKDIRHPKCLSMKYSAKLPMVSVVVPFFEEDLRVLQRLVVSVMNRTPPSILKEVILVDDGSTMSKSTGRPLDEWLQGYPKVRVVRLPNRGGLIASRQAGAKEASADVMVILDSHCEVMTGWLPPLLEPIVQDPETVVCPLIDIINAHDFSYYPQDEGGRGAFDWRFYYKRLPLRPQDQEKYPQPFPNPVMNGGLFAVNLRFFWKLGGYDTGIRIWGGEQYELSFKIWQCGGRILDAPCSRVGHIFRQGGSRRPAARNAGDYISNNYKRVAAVWMDEFAEALYIKKPTLRNFSPGDISEQVQLRERLRCRPFSWFLKEVAPDLAENYPPFEPPDFANGSVESVAYPGHCIDTASRQSGPLILYPSCHNSYNQFFHFSWQKIVELEDEQFCWFNGHSNGGPEIKHCVLNPPPAFLFRYDPDYQYIQSKLSGKCVDIDPTRQMKLTFKACDLRSKTQKWTIKKVNVPAIRSRYPKL